MEVIDERNFKKLRALNNEFLLKIVNEFITLCKPSKVTVITDSKEDIEYCRQKAIMVGEEANLEILGHTIHYDGFYDQARDKENTKVLIPKGDYASPWINTTNRDEGLIEIFEIMDGVMEGKECLIRFFCLGPKNSEFTICALQITDSFYVAHSEDMLYRTGYEEFKKLNGSRDFFYFIHSAGELDGNVTKHVEKRRIFIDLEKGRVLSCFNQYAGNSIGVKKLALRLAINKANNENWLAEHFFIMGVHPKEKKRVTYFGGAFPSGCGKTSTAMLTEQTIVGDDIAYLRKWEDGYAHAVNIEKGIFGIIKDVSPKDDPVIWQALTSPKELIFSNVLINNGVPYWLGDGKEVPKKGINYSGEWFQGKKDKKGNLIPHAHPNARYALRISELTNADPNLHNPNGVPLHAILYGGRDSDTMPPIVESFNWEHGVFLGISIESETTSQTLGAEGIRVGNPMANLDFIVVPLGKYFDNHRKFGRNLTHPPKVFATNYFLKKDGKYLNGMLDKKVWVIWAEGRTHNDFDGINTPIGYIPKYEDLRDIFRIELNKEYTIEEYIEQFTVRVKNILDKLERVEIMFKTEKNIPQFFWNTLYQQKTDLGELMNKYNKEEISPIELL